MRREMAAMRADMLAAAENVTSSKRRKANLEAVMEKLKVGVSFGVRGDGGGGEVGGGGSGVLMPLPSDLQP